MIKHLREANLLLANHRTDAAFHRHKPMNRDWQLVVVCQAHHSPADHECRISSMLAAAAGVTLIATLLGNLFVGPSMGAPLLAANQFACNPRSCGPDRGHRIHWSPPCARSYRAQHRANFHAYNHGYRPLRPVRNRRTSALAILGLVE